MPLYEYRCDACGQRFELIQKFSDPAVETCVSCGGKAHRLPSSPAIQFKGTGWYVTDYARKSRPEAAKAEGPENAKTGAEKSPSSSDKTASKSASSTGSSERS